MPKNGKMYGKGKKKSMFTFAKKQIDEAHPGMKVKAKKKTRKT